MCPAWNPERETPWRSGRNTFVRATAVTTCPPCSSSSAGTRPSRRRCTRGWPKATPSTAPAVPEFRNEPGRETTIRIDSKVGEEIAAGGVNDETSTVAVRARDHWQDRVAGPKSARGVCHDRRTKPPQSAGGRGEWDRCDQPGCASLTNRPMFEFGTMSSTVSEGRHNLTPFGVTTIGRLIKIGCAPS